MRKLLLLSLILCGLFMAENIQAQNVNIELLANAQVSDNSTDIWGYTAPNGDKYAIMGRGSGVSIFDLRELSDPVEVAFLPGANSGWRDIKTWGEYAYVTNETANGLLIIDLTDLPNSAPATDWTGSGDIQFSSAHNIFMDENGVAYIVGADYQAGGAIMIDCAANATNPPILGVYNDRYVHDCFVVNDILYANEGNFGFSIVDVSDKNNPVALGSAQSYGYNHNCWLSDDGSTLFTTDETSGTWVVSWDVTDPTDIQELGRYQSSPGQNVIPHNTFFIDQYVVTSYYRDGVTIADVSNPAAMTEVGNYDTHPQGSGDGFAGCWGVYPYFGDGLIIASDMQMGLFVLDATYQPAAFIEGTVTDLVTAAPINDVTIEISNLSGSFSTDLGGNYAAGFPTDGLVDITFSKFGYTSQTVSGVMLTAGQTEVIDVQLQPGSAFNISGRVIDFNSGAGVSAAGLTFTTTNFESTFQADGSGNYVLNDIFEGFYDVYASGWGYRTKIFSNVYIDPSNDFIVFPLFEGYYDDFVSDLGWTSTNVGSYGVWEIAISNPSDFGFGAFTPDGDVAGDFGDQCYVTGNDDIYDAVQAGSNILTSPTFDLSDYTDPYMSYQTFAGFAAYPPTIPDDTIWVYLSNGTDEVLLNQYTAVASIESTGWIFNNIKISDFLTPTDEMSFYIDARGYPNQSLCEMALDFWQVVDSASLDFDAAALDDDFGDVDAGTTGNSIDVTGNDTNPCTPLYEIIDFNTMVFENVSIDTNGNLSFDVLSSAPEGMYTITYGFSCDGFQTTISDVNVNVLQVVGIFDLLEGSTSIQIFPNPVKDQLFVNLSDDFTIEKEEIMVEIMNANGRVIYSDNMNNTLNGINVQDLSVGLYLLNVYLDGDRIGSGKVIKQ